MCIQNVISNVANQRLCVETCMQADNPLMIYLQYLVRKAALVIILMGQIIELVSSSTYLNTASTTWDHW